MDIFYAATSITVGNGKKTPFWHAPWLGGRKPIDIAPLIFNSSKRKNWKVAQALNDRAWIAKIDLGKPFTADHLRQFVELWTLLNTVTLRHDIDDDIIWRLTPHGGYTTKSAYELQFFGSTASAMDKYIWKAWAPPKVKFFAWLANQKRIWTADRLARRGWPNCGLCPLCKQVTESVDHLFVHCRFTLRLWTRVKDWLGIPELTPSNWEGLSIEDWWRRMSYDARINRKAMASLTMLVSWEVWCERNARVFRNKLAPSFVVFDRIKSESKLWVLAGAKCLGDFMPGE
jgi:hypothetical protein